MAALTQDQLAERLGIASKNVQRIEAGRQNLTLRSLEALALALGVELPQLLLAPGSGLAPLASAPDWQRSLVALGLDLLGQLPPTPPADAVGVYPLEEVSRAQGEPLCWVRLRSGSKRKGVSRRVTRLPPHWVAPDEDDGWWLVRHEDKAPRTADMVLVASAPDRSAPALRRVGGYEADRHGQLCVRLEPLHGASTPLLVPVQATEEWRRIGVLERPLRPIQRRRRRTDARDG